MTDYTTRNHKLQDQIRPKRPMKKTSLFFANCPIHFEDLLSIEITNFGLELKEVTTGGAYFQAPTHQALRYMFHTRLASHIYLIIDKIEASNAEALYRNVKKIDWTKIIKGHHTFKIQAQLTKQIIRENVFKNEIFLSQKIKDGIVDQFVEKRKKRPTVELNNPINTIFAQFERKSFKKYSATLSVRLNQTPLTQRGFKRHLGAAPLRENLAQGLILRSHWDPKTTAFIDLMAGSGTLLMEATLIALDLPAQFKPILKGDLLGLELLPGPLYSSDINSLKRTLKQMIPEILSKLKSPNQFEIIGIEKDRFTASQCRKNLGQSEFDRFVQLKTGNCLELDTVPTLKQKKVVFCNPPYGVRLKNESADYSTEDLYKDIGECLKNKYNPSESYVLAMESKMRKSIQLQTSERIPFVHGGPEGRLLHYSIFDKN